MIDIYKKLVDNSNGDDGNWDGNREVKKGEAPWGWGDESREIFSTTRWRGSLSSSFDFAPTFVSRETDHPSPPPPPPPLSK